MMKKVLALCLSGYSALAIAGFDVVALASTAASATAT